MYLLKLAWKYVNARYVNYVAVIAVALCVMVQIVVMAVLDGMLADMERRVQGFGEQISINYSDDDLPNLMDLESAERKLKSDIPGIEAATPLIRGYAALERGGVFEPVLASGIDLTRYAPLANIGDHLLDKKLDAKNPDWQPPERKTGLPGVFVGEIVANRLGLKTGDEVSLRVALPGTEKIYRERLVVGSTMRSGNYIRDRYFVYVPLSVAQKLFLREDTPDRLMRFRSLSVWLKDATKARALQDSVVKTTIAGMGENGPLPVSFDNWQDQWKRESAGMVHENMLQEIILVLMNLSGGFCVFAILATLAGRRLRDVGLLRCIGASRRKVILLFLMVGGMIGLAGAVAGVAGGYFLTQDVDPQMGPRLAVWYNRVTGDTLYPPHMFGIGKLPVVVNHFKVFLYGCGATLIALLAAAYPALWAGTREPVEALRDE